jgi:hypothetical protein
MSISDPLKHLRSIWNNSELLEFPYYLPKPVSWLELFLPFLAAHRSNVNYLFSSEREIKNDLKIGSRGVANLF